LVNRAYPNECDWRDYVDGTNLRNELVVLSRSEA
jgi:hypothetical protein